MKSRRLIWFSNLHLNYCIAKPLSYTPNCTSLKMHGIIFFQFDPDASSQNGI